VIKAGFDPTLTRPIVENPKIPSSESALQGNTNKAPKSPQAIDNTGLQKGQVKGEEPTSRSALLENKRPQVNSERLTVLGRGPTPKQLPEMKASSETTDQAKKLPSLVAVANQWEEKIPESLSPKPSAHTYEEKLTNAYWGENEYYRNTIHGTIVSNNPHFHPIVTDNEKESNWQKAQQSYLHGDNENGAGELGNRHKVNEQLDVMQGSPSRSLVQQHNLVQPVLVFHPWLLPPAPLAYNGVESGMTFFEHHDSYLVEVRPHYFISQHHPHGHRYPAPMALPQLQHVESYIMKPTNSQMFLPSQISAAWQKRFNEGLSM
ncbi:hypothetical protein CROQUDRAFT_100119, partial [Cronartium quercuum f. sp. fusiforme G11]